MWIKDCINFVIILYLILSYYYSIVVPHNYVSGSYVTFQNTCGANGVGPAPTIDPIVLDIHNGRNARSKCPSHDSYRF